jgi:hypothetical protein
VFRRGKTGALLLADQIVFYSAFAMESAAGHYHLGWVVVLSLFALHSELSDVHLKLGSSVDHGMVS